MEPFEYARPESVGEVLALLEKHGSDARILAGGTDLVIGLRKGWIRSKVVIDLKRVAEIQPGQTTW